LRSLVNLADHGRIHAAILCPPFIERRIAHAVRAAQLGHRHTAFSLAQDRKDLGFAISGHLRQNLLMHLAEKILLMQPLTFGGLPPDQAYHINPQPIPVAA